MADGRIGGTSNVFKGHTHPGSPAGNRQMAGGRPAQGVAGGVAGSIREPGVAGIAKGEGGAQSVVAG